VRERKTEGRQIERERERERAPAGLCTFAVDCSSSPAPGPDARKLIDITLQFYCDRWGQVVVFWFTFFFFFSLLSLFWMMAMAMMVMVMMMMMMMTMMLVKVMGGDDWRWIVTFFFFWRSERKHTNVSLKNDIVDGRHNVP